jgi:hypothetical protein
MEQLDAQPFLDGCQSLRDRCSGHPEMFRCSRNAAMVTNGKDQVQVVAVDHY